MENLVFYDDAKIKIVEFIKDSFPGFTGKLLNQFLDFFYILNNYEEEGVSIRPTILFTNNVDFVLKKYPNSFKIRMFHDENEMEFNSRMKSLIPFCLDDWIIYVDIKENELSFGVCRIFNSIKEKNLYYDIVDNNLLEHEEKAYGFFVKTLSKFTVLFNGFKGTELSINYTFDAKKISNWHEEIEEFIDASFSKLKTTQKKKTEIKLLYKNIFRNVIRNVNGTICVIVDKDYVDNGFLSDGIWLSTPISFKELFVQTKSYNEQKLASIAQLFQSMLNYDGITIVDNAGRIRAYNIFIEPTKVGNIMGGARKRAAYSIINSRRKKIIGVYFQSHEGEIFYKNVKK